MTQYELSVLNRRRVVFNPADTGHLMEFAAFIKYRNWRAGCPFYLEEPYDNIPAMLNAKVARHAVLELLDKV